ncbi:MAG TPA: response regulator transcription factor [Magnetovibrio sp.]
MNMDIVIADDHSLVREGLAAVLEQQNAFSSVLAAGTLDELKSVLDHNPGVGIVLLDLNMPGMNDVQSLEELQECYPTTSFAILSATEVASVARRMLEAGAVGYIPKSANNTLLISALHLILSGNVYVPPFAMNGHKRRAKCPVELTDRQMEVLQLMAQGHSNKEIGRILDLSESTVKTHTSTILKIFGVDNRTKAIREAIRLGLAEAP